MLAKRGRPASGKAKNRKYSVRLSTEEDMNMVYMRFKTGYSTSKVISEALKMYYENLKRQSASYDDYDDYDFLE